MRRRRALLSNGSWVSPRGYGYSNDRVEPATDATTRLGLGIGRGFLDQVQDHVPARPQPLADLEHELVAQHRRFFEPLGLRRLHAAPALLRALFLRNGRNRHEEAVGCDWGDIRPDLVGRHARIINPALASRLPRHRRPCSCPNVKGRHVSALSKDLGLRGLATRLPWDVAGSAWRRPWPRARCSRAVRRAWWAWCCSAEGWP